jgi:hypothetical protein
MPTITSFTRFKSNKTEEMVKAAKQGKAIFEKHGAEFLRMSRFHTGMWAGEWLIVTRYASWEVYGKVQEAVAKDEAFAKLMAHTATIAELTGRNISVGVDL